MIMLRGSPTSDSTSQHTLITPYRSGAGTQEEEEEFALLQHLEKMQQPQPQEDLPRARIAHRPLLAENDPQQRQNTPSWQPDHADDHAWAGEPAGIRPAADPHQRPWPQPQELAVSSEQHPGGVREAPASDGEQALRTRGHDPWFRQQAGRTAASLHGSPARADSSATQLMSDGAHWRGGAALAGGLPLAAAPPPGQAHGQGRAAGSPADAGPAQPAPHKAPPRRAEPPLTTTIRIGDYPLYGDQDHSTEKKIQGWNTQFRNSYGQFAVDAARKAGVPARLLAALSANEMAAPNWGAFHAFADRNTSLTKSVGPLQIASTTALKHGLVPVENEFYNARPEDVRAALHDPDVRHGRSSPPSGLTPAQRLERRDDPYPNNPNSRKFVHDYLDNPATSFDAGAKLLNIYLKKLADDYKSGAWSGYSKDFRDLMGLSREGSEIRKDLEILASGDKEAIFNLRPSASLARALAMMWNNGEDIVNVNDYFENTPNAATHGAAMLDQHPYQDDLIPEGRTIRHPSFP